MNGEQIIVKKGRNGSLLSIRVDDGVSWQLYERNGTN